MWSKTTLAVVESSLTEYEQQISSIHSENARYSLDHCHYKSSPSPLFEVIFGAGPVAPLLSALVTALLFILWGLGSTAIPGGALRWFLAWLGAVTPEMEGWNFFVKDILMVFVAGVF